MKLLYTVIDDKEKYAKIMKFDTRLNLITH